MLRSISRPAATLLLAMAFVTTAAGITVRDVQAQASTSAPASASVAADEVSAPAAKAPEASPAPMVLPAPPDGAETAENPYGLESLWRTSDGVAKAVLLVLVIMSMGTWYILIVKVIEQAKIGRQA